MVGGFAGLGAGRASLGRLGVAAIGLAACLAGGAQAAAPEAGATPDAPAATPVAAPGSPAATASSISRSSLRRQLRSALRSAGGRSGAWVFDTGAQAKPVLFARNARSRRILASNQKLFTTAAVLDRFGPGRQFRTAVYARGKRVGVEGQVLDGNLVIRGAGDPALGTQSFARRNGLPLTRIGMLATAVKAAGIRVIRGDIRADDTIFDRRRGIPATGFRAGPYLSPLSGLSFNSGHARGRYSSAPELAAARALRRALERHEIRVRGDIGRASLPRTFLAHAAPVGAVSSPRLADLAAATNKPSNNFFAEMLLKRLASGPKVRGTTRRGARRVQRFARRMGTGVRASDGSGLGRGNRATPRQVGRLLRALNRSEIAAAFHQTLAVAGRDGTLASRMRGTAAEGRCRAKTGTLTGVSTLSGYCSVGGGRIVFSILMGGVDLSRARSAQDRMVTAIARYRR